MAAMGNSPTRYTQPGAQRLLMRILDEPELVRVVQSLPPRALGKLIDHVGLEDSGELIALATTEQLRRIFDEDLWRSERPGKDETFDPERFSLWLEVMLEAGGDFAARRLTELPEDLVTLALFRQVLVINVDELAIEMEGSGARGVRVEKALESCLHQEFAEYRVISKRQEGWDAVVAVLAALDEQHHEFLQRLFERCCHASAELIDDCGGLYQALTSEEMLETDAAAEREDRRATEGYIAPSAALSFLRLARESELQALMNATAGDPITRAYFRAFQSSAPPAPKSPPARRQGAAASVAGKAGSGPLATLARGDEQGSATRLMELLKEAEVIVDARPTPMLAEGVTDERTLFKRAMVSLHDEDPELHARRVQELSYLANVLVAGGTFEGRAFRSFEAVDAALAVCDLGLRQFLAPDQVVHSRNSNESNDSDDTKNSSAKRKSGDLRDLKMATEILTRHDAVKIFRVGWRVLPDPLFRGGLPR